MIKMEKRLKEIFNKEDIQVFRISKVINDYLQLGKYSKKLIALGGFNYLLNKWEEIVNTLPYDKSFHYQHDDYLHHLNIRCSIFDVKQNCKITKKIKEFIRKTDKIFIKKTVEVPYVWINRNSTEDPEDPQVYRFYYRVPPERIPNWYSEGSTEMKIYREWLGCYNENS